MLIQLLKWIMTLLLISVTNFIIFLFQILEIVHVVPLKLLSFIILFLNQGKFWKILRIQILYFGKT